MTEADNIAIATIAPRMNIFFLFLGNLPAGGCDGNGGGAVKQYNIKDIRYNMWVHTSA